MTRFIGCIFALVMTIPALLAADAGPIQFRKTDLYGVWLYRSAYTEFPDGRIIDQFGPKPIGIFVIMPNGRYSHIVMDSTMPPIKSGLLKVLTPQEAEELAVGTLAHYGTYTVNERAGTFTVHIDHSSFPNFDGLVQERQVLQLDKKTLRYMNPISTAGKGAKVYAELTKLADFTGK